MNSEPSTESLPALPDDLIYEIIEACDGLTTQRNETLCSLGRLAKRFTATAQKVLYHEITVDLRSAKHTRFTKLRMKLHERPAMKAWPRVCTVRVAAGAIHSLRYINGLPLLANLQQMHVVNDSPLTSFSFQALACVLWRQQRNLVSFSIDCYYPGLYSLLASLGDEPNLSSLRLHNLPQRQPEQRVHFPALTSVHVERYLDVEAFQSIASTVKSTLVSLGLPLSKCLEAIDPSNFPRLGELVLYGSDALHAYRPDAALSANTFFLSCAALPFLAALRLHLRRHPSSSFPTRPGSSCALSFLALVPPRIEHLDLTESTFSRADVEAFFYGATRPARLRTLRWDDTTLEGGAKQSKSEDEDEEEDWRERLREKLAAWGVEVTTLKLW